MSDFTPTSYPVVSTREIIEKLQEYERLNGIGAIVNIATYLNGNEGSQYRFEIANDSDYNRVFHNNDNHYKVTNIEISSIDDLELFKNI